MSYDVASLNRTNAEALCSADNSIFPIILDADTNNFLKTFANNNFWIGLTCQTPTNCSWSDNSIYTYNNFLNNKADVNIGNYVYVQHSQEHTNFYGVWASEDDQFVTNSVICRQNPDYHYQNCPPNYEYISDDNSNCYKYVSNVKSFNDSVNVCIEDLGNLVSIHSSKENQDIVNFANKKGNDKSLWIGLIFDEASTNSSWVDQTNVSYLNYMEEFPIDFFGGAVEMLLLNDLNSLGYWENTDFKSTLPFICKMTENEVTNYWNSKVSTQSPIHVNTLSPEGQCPKNKFYKDNGTINSPGYPNLYGDNLNCEYYLINTMNERVVFTITDFYIADDDILEIYESNYIKLIQQFTGYDNNNAIGQTIITSNENSMVLVFKTSSVHFNQFRGFMGTFNSYDSFLESTIDTLTTLPSVIDQTNSSTCPFSLFTDPSAQIDSPGYPNPFGSNLMCFYIIKAVEGKRIALSILDHYFSQVGVSLEIYNGKGETNDKIISITKDDNQNKTISTVSKSNYLTIVFYSSDVDGDTNDKWSLWYRIF
uniref:CUB domain-containing protein n=1 Tax=Parastrongyloides trichosuri TaxID=131310 RepID=A0A0N4ZWV2_PARTI